MVRILNWEKFAKVTEFDTQYLQSGCGPEKRLRIVE